MRKIPDHITDAAAKTKLTQIDKQIDEKMIKVNALRAKMKKKEFTPAEIEELKKIGGEIDQLDREWKSLVGAG